MLWHHGIVFGHPKEVLFGRGSRHLCGMVCLRLEIFVIVFSVNRWGSVAILAQATGVPTAAPLRLIVYRCGNDLRLIDAHIATKAAA